MSKAEQAIENYAYPQRTRGKSIIEQLWEELDTVMDRLMVPDSAAEAADGQDRGRAEGLAVAIMIMQQSYPPYHLDYVRHEAYERWEAREMNARAPREVDTCGHCGERVEIGVDELYEPGSKEKHECVLQDR